VVCQGRPRRAWLEERVGKRFATEGNSIAILSPFSLGHILRNSLLFKMLAPNPSFGTKIAIDNYVTHRINQADKSKTPRKRVLLVDDEAPIREALERVLVLEQYEVVCASTGRGAIETAYESRIDLVLLDLNIPDQDGWEICRRLTDLKPVLPVIIITARPGQAALLGASKARAVMEKPLDLPLLLNMVSQFLLVTDQAASSSGPAPCRAGDQ
jgi:CheY-like chemotaxis protein